MSYIAILVLTLISTSLTVSSNTILNLKGLITALVIGSFSLISLYLSSEWDLVFQSLFIIVFTINAWFLSIQLASKLSINKAGG